MPPRPREIERIGALKAEDRLFEVADGEQGARPIAVCAFAREEFLGQPRDDRPLREVGVLRLLDQDMLCLLVELVAHPLAHPRLFEQRHRAPEHRKTVVLATIVSVRVYLVVRLLFFLYIFFFSSSLFLFFLFFSLFFFFFFFFFF